jgi:predicted SAM-dependent methyltransferase
MFGLDLGCGEHPAKGYLGIDVRRLSNVKIVADVFKGLPIVDNSVDVIRANHVLEHEGHGRVLAVLKDWYKVLKPGGTIEVNVPNLAYCSALAIAAWLTRRDEAIYRLAHLWGEQDSPYNFHKTGFTSGALKHLLEEAGFKKVRVKAVKAHSYRGFNLGAVTGWFIKGNLQAWGVKPK